MTTKKRTYGEPTEPQQYVVVIDEPGEQEAIGPFATPEDAEEYGRYWISSNHVRGVTFNVRPLHGPRKSLLRS